jgi:hypothetical protein
LRLFPAVLTLTTASLVFVSVAPSAALSPALPEVSTENAPEQGSGIGIRLVDVPTATQNDPRARSYIIDNLRPGETIRRRLQVQNNTASSQAVSVYACSARIVGNSFVGDDGASANELTSWTSVDRPQLNLPAGETADVLATVSVPVDAIEGESYAALWAEVRSAADPQSHIVSASRVGIRMYVSVGAGSGPTTDFSVGSVTANRSSTGTAEVRATVTNTGGRALDLAGTLTLTNGPSGLSAGPFETVTVATLAPGDSGELTFVLGGDIPAGPWDGHLTVRSGLLSHDATTRLTFPEVKLRQPVTPKAAWDFRLVSLLIGGAGLVIGAGIFAANRSRRRPRPGAAPASAKTQRSPRIIS